MDVIEHNKIKIVSDYIYTKNMNPKTIVKKEMVIEHGFMTMDKEEYKIKKAKEMYELRLAYIEGRNKKEQTTQSGGFETDNKSIMQQIEEDVDMSCSSEDDKGNDDDDDEMVNLEATYESISYVIK
jgi:hypothetical protein